MIRIGVIGTNVITDNFIEAAKRCKDFKLQAVYSRSIDKAKQYAKKHGAELAFDQLTALSECESVDAVYVASPNSLHARQSIQMMKNGKHVLCEKTIASNLPEFQEMTETAKKYEVVLLEAMRSVYCPGFRMIRENLKKLGTIRRASFQYCQYSSRYDNFKKGIVENAFNPALSNGALMDIGVYCVHPLAALFGMPKKIQSNSIFLPNGAEAAGTILAEYEGMQGELMYSKISNSKIPSQIQGEDASMIIREIPNPQEVIIYYRDGRQEKLDIPQIQNNMYYEAEEFIRLIQQKEGSTQYLNFQYLKNSQTELQIMDEVRRQQNIVFPADKRFR